MALQRGDLLLDAAAAEDRDGLQAAGPGEEANVLIDLHGQLARGHENQRLHAAAGREQLEHGQSESGGFAGAGAGLAEAVAAGEGKGDELALDVGGSLEAHPPDGLKGLGVQAELGPTGLFFRFAGGLGAWHGQWSCRRKAGRRAAFRRASHVR